MQKYSCEFGLGVYCSYKTLIPVENLDLLERDTTKYHTYAILSTPKISIKNLSKNSNGLNFTLVKHFGENDKEYQLENIDILGFDIDYTKAEITLKYPYSTLTIEFDEKYFNDFYKSKKIPISKSEFLKYRKLIIDNQMIFNAFVKENKNEMEIMYIGQAYGKKGNRTALDRLKSHEKLIEILSKCNSEYPNERIYILLMQMNSQIVSGFNGISNQFMYSEEKSQKHLKDVMSNLPKENQIINITEAAMINYFKPEYNKDFVNNFPSVKHKGYRQYYDLDYNCITIELDMEFQGAPYLELYTTNNRLSSPFQAIEYDLFNDPNRSNMNDIFKKKS